MKYLILILALAVAVSCNSSSETANSINSDRKLDSLVESTDSNNLKLIAIDTSLTLFAKAYLINRSEVQVLRQEKKDLIQQLEQKYPNYQAIQSDDAQLKRINELNNLLIQKEFENAQLKKKIYYDSLYRSRPSIGNKLRGMIEENYVMPNSKSLVITLDKKIKGDGEISDRNISVYIMPYNKKSKKLMNYDMACDMSKINSLSAKQANYYEGIYFFNDIPPGKYLIKVCSYCGNYKVVERGEEVFQEIAMQVSPPIQ